MIRRVVAACTLLAASTVAFADEVVMQDGDVLKGTVVEKTDVEVVLRHPVLGTLKIPAGRVKEVRIDGAEEKKLPEPPKPPEPPKRNWKAQLEAGLNGAEGNADNINLIAGFKYEHTVPRTVTKFEARYTFTETSQNVPGPDNNIEAKQSRLTSGLRRDWIHPGNEDLSLFVEVRYDRDINQSWKQRANAAVGVAYKFINRERFFLAGRVGGAATKEWGNEENPLTTDEERDLNRHVRPEGLVGLETKWKPTVRQEITAQSTWYPDLSDLWESRVLSSAGWSLKLDGKGSMSLRAGVEHEWDTHHVDPIKRQDVRYFALLVVDF